MVGPRLGMKSRVAEGFALPRTDVDPNQRLDNTNAMEITTPTSATPRGEGLRPIPTTCEYDASGPFQCYVYYRGDTPVLGFEPRSEAPQASRIIQCSGTGSSPPVP